MLSMRTFASGRRARMRRVATAPFMLGRAKSMTMTSGFKARADSTASKPSLASPTTVMPGSSSSIRRKPWRTRLWSSTSNTLMSVCCIRLRLVVRRYGAHQSAACLAARKFNCPLDQVDALAHGDEAESVADFLGVADAFVFDFHHERVHIEPQAHYRAVRLGMPYDVVQRLLDDAVQMDRNFLVRFVILAFSLIGDMKAGALPETREISRERAGKPGFVEHRWMQRLRERAHFFERGLHNFVDFAEFIGGRDVFARGAAAGALEHGSNGGQDLAEFVVQFARDGAEGALLRRDELLGEVAAALGEHTALFGKVGDAVKQPPIVLDEIEAGQHV